MPVDLNQTIRARAADAPVKPILKCARHTVLGVRGSLLLFMIAGLSILPAQVAMDVDRPESLESLARRFDQLGGVRAMKCEFQSMQPYLNFGLVHETGYVLRFPKGEFTGRDHKIDVALRLTSLSEARMPTFLSNVLTIPTIPGAGQYVQVSARFGIDPGSYKIDSLATDDEGRVCRGQWNLVVARRSSGARVSMNYAHSRVTIFLDATPGIIDYASLKRHVGPASFLTQLVEREVREQEKSEVVIFLGPVSHAREDLPKNDVFAVARSTAAFYYLQYRPPQSLADSDSPTFRSAPPAQRTSGGAVDYPQNAQPIGIGPAITPPDTIQHFMRRVSGRTIVFSTPEEFGSVIDKIAPPRVR
jgi:hypothetical protein